MIDFLLKSTISLIVFLGFYHLILEREKMHRFNRFYLLISIIISFVIPFVTFEIIKIVPVVQNMEPLNTIVTSSALPESEIQGNVIPIEEKINFIPYVLWSLYGIISFLLLIRFGKNILKLIVKSKSNSIVKYKNANLILVEEKTLPHTFLNSIFINFEDYNNRNIEEELYTHELVHVTQKHTLDILFIEFLKVVFWFNPIFIFYKKAIQLNHEFLADEEIVKTYNNVPFYQNLLLQKGSCNQTIYLASNLNYLVTKKRLIMMTKSTSKKIALLKKVAIVPILAGLIYFFCIEVVAQEKIINTNSNDKNLKTTDKDKIRDSYYSGVYVKIIDEKNKRNEVILYENLSLQDRRRYLDFVPEMMIEKEIPQPLFEKMKTKDMAVWINGKIKTKEDIKKYKRTDFSYYTYSFVHKNARSKRFPQEYQYTLYTKYYFEENLKNSHIHFKGDTIKIGYVKYETAMKNKIAKNIKTDTLVWFTEGKEGYNLYVNDSVKKKNKIPSPKPTYCPEVDPKKESIEVKKIEDKKEIENLNNGIVEKLSDYDTKGKNTGYIYMKSGTYFFTKENNTIEYYNRWGLRVNEKGEEITKREYRNLIEVDEKPEYIGGIQEFYKFIRSNYKIPLNEFNQKIFGIIYVDFIIEKDGSLSNINIVRDIGYKSGEEAKRVLEKCPRWKPGKVNNELVRVKYTLPIKISSE